MTPREAQQALLFALVGAGVRGIDDPGGLAGQVPAAVVGPPTLTWTTGDSDPNEASFSIFLVVQADDRAVERLYELLPVAVEAIESAEIDAVVRTAEPGTFLAGNTNLPCYIVRTEVPL